jgi:hypothetical protein
MSGVVIVDPITSDGKIPVDSRPAREFGAVSAYGLPKFAFERILRDYKFNDALLQISFNQTVSGIGTATTSPPFSLNITTGAQASSGVVLTTKQNHVHPVGKGLILKVFATFKGGATTNNHRSFGLYNDNNGFFIRLNGTSLEFVTRQNAVDTVVDSSTWDITPTVDDKTHLWYIQSEGSGVGDYEIWYDEQLVHRVNNLGVLTGPQINQTDLPLRIANVNLTNATDVEFEVEGASVATEGEESVRLTDGTNEAVLSQSRRLLTEGFGSPLMEQSMDETIDTVTRWSETIVGAASKSQPADTYTLFLSNTTGATDSIELNFNEANLRESIGAFCEFEIGAKFGSTLQVGNRREWGYLDAGKLNGIFFRVDGPELKFVTLKGGVETVTDITSSIPNANFHLYKITHLGAGKISGFIDNRQVIDFSPAAISVVGDAEKKPFIKMYNTAGLAGTPSDSEFHWMALRDLSGTSVTIVGKDSNNAFKPVAVSTTGRLLVSQEPPTPPPATTSIRITEKSVMSGTVDSFYTITNGTLLTIQTLSGGAQSSNSGHIIELFEDPTGTGTPLNAIEDIYVNGSSDQKDLLGDFVGDGTRRILLRRRAFGGGNNDVTGIWQGYET